MKRLLRSQFLRDFGSVGVLIALCAYYSFVTYSEHHPMTAQAGREMARGLIANAGDTAQVLIVAGNTTQDQEFAGAVSEEINRRGGKVVSTVLANRPSDVREALVELGQSGTRVNAVATHQRSSQWGPLQSRQLGDLAEEYRSLRDIAVYIPASYFWPSFLTRANLTNVIKNNADIAIIAIGMTMVIITAGIDLSVGSVLALAAVLTAVLMESWSAGGNASAAVMAASALIGVLVAAAVGLFSGVMVTWCRVPAFIVTLAMMMVARGLSLIIAVQYQKSISDGTTEGTPEAVKINTDAFSWLGNGEWLGIPNPIWVMIVLYAAAHILMTRTSLGRYIYAVGGNPEAARLSGVPVFGVLLLVYVLCSAFAGLAGVMDASRFEGGRPKAGDLYELRVIAAVVVGGTSLAGGEGRILGTLVGALIIAVIQNGLNMAGVADYEQRVIFGCLILGAALLDSFQKSKA